MTDSSPYRDLPSVDELASRRKGSLPWPMLADLARDAIDRARASIKSRDQTDTDPLFDSFDEEVTAMQRSSGVKVINATGVLLHTNLGRAPWSTAAAAAASESAQQYTNLELDLASGVRGRRGGFVTALLSSLTGAEDAMVVNNNAASVVLSLAALAEGQAVPVSRGELIEIGGAYRLPDVMEASGARLVEVGTTNRTRVGDYQTALQAYECGAILKVHPSNYSVEGFTAQAGVDDLAGLAGAAGIPLIYDIGSGLLDETTPWLPGPTPDWLRAEPGAAQAIARGADVVTFSGDKLLGGPQAGVVVGSAAAVARMRSHPLARALRVDGPTLSALGSTLAAYAAGDATGIPFWRMALADAGSIRSRAERLAGSVGGVVVDGESAVGGGSVPGAGIESAHLVLPGEDHLFGPLKGLATPIVTRREAGSLIIDLRTVHPEDDDQVADGVAKCR